MTMTQGLSRPVSLTQEHPDVTIEYLSIGDVPWAQLPQIGLGIRFVLQGRTPLRQVVCRTKWIHYWLCQLLFSLMQVYRTLTSSGCLCRLFFCDVGWRREISWPVVSSHVRLWSPNQVHHPRWSFLTHRAEGE